MAYTAHPVWLFPPNWGSDIVEKLEWKTDVLTSETGVEQRVSRRLTPRRYFTATFLLHKSARQQAEMYLSGQGAAVWLIPIWHSVTKLTADVAAGASTITLDTRWREYAVGDLVILRGKTLNSWEVGTIQSLTDNDITFTAPLENDWTRETYVYPARLARIQFNLTADKKTDNLSELRVTFKLDQANRYVSVVSFPTFSGAPVLEQRPDDSVELSFGYERIASTMDNDTGIPTVVDMAGKTFLTTGYRWAIVGRQKAHDFRQLLTSLRGRAKALWIPTFMDDFTLTANVTAGDVALTVKNVGYTSYGARLAGHEDIRIQLADGTVYYRHISASTVVDANTETLSLSASLPTGFAVGEVRAISFMQLSRLSEDTLELRHATDIDGATECDAAWRGPVTL